MARTLRVLLNETPVGLLSLAPGEGSDFRLLESYKVAYPRPVLGQTFLDDLDQIHHTRARVPAWFSNLLPEGPLRELIARQAGMHISREFHLLRHLGEDLPGAVRIVADDDRGEEAPDEAEVLTEEASHGQPEAWHFSLAGVQLKFSANKSERGLTVPISGRGGDWIVKLPDARFRRVPENEYATMRWAQASGIPIPDIELVPTERISGLPTEYAAYPEAYALAIRRFDRPSPGVRVHMEDFAQILSLYPEEKYKKFNHETLGRVILALAGVDGLEDYIHRLVFVIAAGNGDAHHKNWSLVYPDGVNARLSPAYDLVSTIQYQPDDQLALNLGGSKQWADMNMEIFRRMARKIGVDEALMASWVHGARAAILDSWRENGPDFGFDTEARKRIELHLAGIPLLAPR